MTAIQRIEKELKEVKLKYRTEHDDHEPYWRGVRVGLEVSLNILKESQGIPYGKSRGELSVG